jgi:hypothetical protein
MDVLERDLVDVQSLSRHNDGYKYLLMVIDVFSKFLHTYSFKSVGTPILNAPLLNESSDPCVINCTDILHIKTRTDKLTYFQTL